jgi:hypothetical protein
MKSSRGFLMNRRDLFKVAASAAAVVAMPSFHRNLYENETLHTYEPLLVRDGFFMTGCILYAHHGGAIFSLEHEDDRALITNCHITRYVDGPEYWPNVARL